jgi:isoaspartyl peptidase/L-asparaginase-like protein (Ntn-hydrolase superfamily)
MRAVAAHEVAAAVRHGQQPLTDAVRCALARIEGAAGLIAVGPDGDPAIEFNTEVFHRAVVSTDGIRTAVAADWR